MKILHLTNNYPTDKFPISGIFVKEQIDSLKKFGFDTRVYLINGREKGKFEYIKHVFKLRSFLKKNNFDIVHVHHALSAFTLILSGMAKKNRVIVSFQNDPVNEYGLKLYDFIKKRTDAWIFKNNSKLIISENHYYLPNGVNTEIFKPIHKNEACNKLGIDPSKRYVLFVSSNFLRQQKRYDIFNETLIKVKEDKSFSDLEELKLINVERKLVPYYFNAAEVHLLTSDFEGSPNSIKEALACNTPVVSTPVGNVPELVRDINNAFVSSGNDPHELAGLLKKALGIKYYNSRDQIINKGLDIESVARKLLNIYEKYAN